MVREQILFLNNNLHLGLVLKAENSISYAYSIRLRAETPACVPQGETSHTSHRAHNGGQAQILSQFLHMNS